MAIEIVSFPIKNGDFPIAMLVYQRVMGVKASKPRVQQDPLPSGNQLHGLLEDTPWGSMIFPASLSSIG